MIAFATPTLFVSLGLAQPNEEVNPPPRALDTTDAPQPPPLEAPLEGPSASASLGDEDPVAPRLVSGQEQAPALSGVASRDARAAPDGRTFRQDRESEFENGHSFELPSRWLEWHGNAQVDVAFLDYRFTDSSIPHEQLYDLRGRFVMGPTLYHAFRDGYFVRARAEFVAWLREINDSYQVNVDDAFVQGGKVGLWDVKVGRFFSWRVYHRGPGFDLFTSEDLGACVDGNCAAQDPSDYAPRMYDVSNVYFRDTPGRLAFHYYPTASSGIEALVQYGSMAGSSANTTSSGSVTTFSNSLGARLAGIFGLPLFRASAALELRHIEPTTDQVQAAEGGGTIPCPACGTSSDVGLGGGVELTPRELGLELALNVGYSLRSAYLASESRMDEATSGEILTLGGYAQFDWGKYLWGQSLVFGLGYNYTQNAQKNRDYGQQGQLAAYLLWPLDFFQGAAVKFVYSNMHYTFESDDGRDVLQSASDSNAFRLRFSLNY